MKHFTFAVSIGDINGVSAEILLNAHQDIKPFCDVAYCVHPELLALAASKLNLTVPPNLNFQRPSAPLPVIEPGENKADSGKYSYESFKTALELADNNQVDGIVTLPVSKKAWNLAGYSFKGHTDMLSARYQTSSIMMLGNGQFWVSLFTDHIPIGQVPEAIQIEPLTVFLKTFSGGVNAGSILVTGLNPHAGEDGVLGEEDNIIKHAVELANRSLGKRLFYGPVSADSAFIEHNRQKFNHVVVMYHDQGLIPLKTLYFDRLVNVSLNLPVKRVSVGHGTAFDIAYGKPGRVSNRSYLEAVKTLQRWCMNEKL